jgi:hypothetical protein
MLSFMSMKQDCLWTAATKLLFIPHMIIWVWRAMVKWYWQGKAEELREKLVPVPFCPPQIPHQVTQVLTQASAVRDQPATNHLSHITALLRCCVGR